MTDRLTPQNVTVTTATIEVRTLTLGNRQITQSVFRQLQEESLVDGDGNFRGQPWGFVNHCPDKKVPDDNLTGTMIECASGPAHRHVVWQKGDELRRSRVVTYVSAHRGAFWDDATDAIAQAAYCANDHVMPAWVIRHGSDSYVFEHDGVRCIGYNLSKRWDAGHECPSVDALPAARARLTEAITSERALAVAQRAAWKAVLKLPQLFIAV